LRQVLALYKNGTDHRGSATSSPAPGARGESGVERAASQRTDAPQ
jgi:hypothetical protein